MLISYTHMTCTVMLQQVATVILYRLIVALIITKFTYEQYATMNQTNAGRFDPRVETSCICLIHSCVLLISEFH